MLLALHQDGGRTARGAQLAISVAKQQRHVRISVVEGENIDVPVTFGVIKRERLGWPVVFDE